MSAAEDTRRRGLGRGLSALLGEATADVAVSAAASSSTSPRGPQTLPVENVRPGRFQPRHRFDPEGITDLIESVREKGILQPILVRPHPDKAGDYEIIAGERRWRAAQAASLHVVPVIIRDLTDREALEVGLIENLQRQDLTALEEAEGYRRLMEEFSHTQEELARTVGKSRSHVANMMRLLALPEPVKLLLDQGDLTAGHARALLTAADPVGLAQQVVSRGLNVRQTEGLAQKPTTKTKGKGVSRSVQAEAKDADLLALERDLAAMLGLKVNIRHAANGGEVSIEYGTLEQLDDILHRLSNGAHGRPTLDE